MSVPENENNPRLKFGDEEILTIFYVVYHP